MAPPFPRVRHLPKLDEIRIQLSTQGSYGTPWGRYLLLLIAMGEGPGKEVPAGMILRHVSELRQLVDGPVTVRSLFARAIQENPPDNLAEPLRGRLTEQLARFEPQLDSRPLSG
jgi:hypothetical protein